MLLGRGPGPPAVGSPGGGGSSDPPHAAAVSSARRHSRPRAHYALLATQPLQAGTAELPLLRLAADPARSLWPREGSRPAGRGGTGATQSSMVFINPCVIQPLHSGDKLPSAASKSILCKENKPPFFWKRCLLFWSRRPALTPCSVWQALGEQWGTGLICGAQNQPAAWPSMPYLRTLNGSMKHSFKTHN